MNWQVHYRSFASLVVTILLALLLSSCGFPGMVSTSQQLPVVSQTPSATPFPPVRFPEDEGAHNNLTEWWYYTGHFETTEPGGKSRQYGFELVVFQVLRSDLPPLYASHFAISDLTRGEFQYDQRRLMEPRTIPAASKKGIDLRVHDWSIQGVNGRDHLIAAMQDYAIDLILVDRKAPVLHDGKGLITYGLAGFSYYYSRTHMELSGTLLDHGQSLRVTGKAWMDHQWGDFLTLADSGWDWYSIQLDNDTEIMLYFIRDDKGKTIATYVGYIDEKGNNAVIPASALHFTVLNHWKSPETGITYPSGWRLEINDPALQTTLTVLPQLRDQELVVRESTGNIYWEGAVKVQGQSGGKPIQGQGYVELTGYTNG